MIKKLTVKFITVSLLSMFLVLSGILLVGNIFLSKNINIRTDNMLEILLENGGEFPNEDEDDKKLKYKNFKNRKNNRIFDINFDIDEEDRFETRYFSIIFDKDDAILYTNTVFVASISQDDVVNIATEVYEGENKQGYKDVYKYKVKDYKDGKLIVFVDSRRDLATINLFRLISVIILFLSMIITFVITKIFTRIALKPVEESYEKQKRFITDASHEIKTPLAIIDANTDIIELENGESEWTKSTKNQVTRLTNLTNSLVSLTRMDEDISVDMDVFSLSDLVNEEYYIYLPLAKVKNKNIELKLDENIKYYGNEQYIMQMLGILLDNAIKYSDENSTIILSLTDGAKKKIIVENKAGNMGKNKNYDILFERFYRIDSSRNSSTGGYGIGLSLAHSIVTMHKGKISANTTKDGSLIFEVVL